MSWRYMGVALPWGSTLPSFIEPKEDDYILKTSILFILMTTPGERVFLPEFGSNLKNLVFEQNDDSLASQIKQSIEEAITRWDPRVKIVKISVTQDLNHHIVNCSLVFKDRKDPTNETETVEFSLSATETL